MNVVGSELGLWRHCCADAVVVVIVVEKVNSNTAIHAYFMVL